MKLYIFHGIRYKQEELTFAQDGIVRELLVRIAGSTGPNATLGEWLDAVLREQIAESLFEIILKPHEPTLLHRWGNRCRLWRKGIAPGGRGILPHLHNSQVAEVLADFFDLNTSWMSGFSGIVNALAEKRQAPLKADQGNRSGL